MNRKIPFAAATVFLLAVIPLLAHHPFSADFDWKKAVTITGTVTSVEWKEPHAMIQIDSQEGGAAARWSIELGSPKILAKYGWTQDGLKRGEKITVDGWQAKDGSKMLSARFVTLPGGRMLFGASSFYDTPYRASKGKTGSCVSDENCIDMNTPISQR